MTAKILSIFFNHFAGNDRTILHAEQTQHGMEGRKQPEFECGIIPSAECIDAGNSFIKNPGSAAGSFFIKNPGKAENNIGCLQTPSLSSRESFVIVKKNIGSKMKSVSFFI